MMYPKLFLCIFILSLMGCSNNDVSNSQEEVRASFIQLREDFQQWDETSLWEYSFNNFDSKKASTYKVQTTTASALGGLELSFHGGTNHSLLLLSRKIDNTQLEPNQIYNFTVNLNLLTNISTYISTKEGAPGFNTYIKIGLLAQEPDLTQPYNFHIGSKEHSGKDLITLGNIGHTEKIPPNDYAKKTMTQIIQAQTNEKGQLWVLIAFDGYSQHSIQVILEDLEITVLPT